MGRDLHAARMPETHNDDFIGQPVVAPEGAGTIRLYARVEVVENANKVRSLQSVTTLEVSEILVSEFPALYRAAEFPGPVHEAAGELFRLPGFEPHDDPPGSWNEITVTALRPAVHRARQRADGGFILDPRRGRGQRHA